MEAMLRVGRVCLVTRDAGRLSGFYRDRIGLVPLGTEDGIHRLGSGGRELLRLREVRGASPRGRTAGLFHLALLLPDRRELAIRFRHLLETDTPLEGTADHGVSEAIYLSDPDGNGIEIYRDRPRESWFGTDGALRMGTWALDVEGLLREAEDGAAPGGAVELGHIHLRVCDVGASERFYTEAVGLELMMRYGARAGFVSSGSYHHHVGFNTWGGPFLPAPEEASTGLGWFSLRLTGPGALDQAARRLEGSRVPFRRAGEGLRLRDPSNLELLLET